MKLRLKGNSLRLRLTRSELRQFAESGQVEERVDFGSGKLDYRLCATPDGESMRATLAGNSIIVWMPRSVAEPWLQTELVSLRDEQALDSGSLRILVEKDFRCLTERQDEDETDMFDHPLAGPPE